MRNFHTNLLKKVLFDVFKKVKNSSLIKIGTSGNWVKISTGYLFQNALLILKKS